MRFAPENLAIPQLRRVPQLRREKLERGKGASALKFIDDLDVETARLIAEQSGLVFDSIPERARSYLRARLARRVIPRQSRLPLRVATVLDDGTAYAQGVGGIRRVDSIEAVLRVPIDAKHRTFDELLPPADRSYLRRDDKRLDDPPPPPPIRPLAKLVAAEVNVRRLRNAVLANESRRRMKQWIKERD